MLLHLFELPQLPVPMDGLYPCMHACAPAHHAIRYMNARTLQLIKYIERNQPIQRKGWSRSEGAGGNRLEGAGENRSAGEGESRSAAGEGESRSEENLHETKNTCTTSVSPRSIPSSCMSLSYKHQFCISKYHHFHD